MQTTIDSLLQSPLTPWAIVTLMYIFWVVGLLILKKTLFTYLRRLVGKTSGQWDDVLIKAADWPLHLLIFTSGGVMIHRMGPTFIESQDTHFLVTLFKAATIFAIALFFERFLTGLVKAYSSTIEILNTSSVVIKGFIRIVIVLLFGLVLLDNFGISITPVLASLGIGSLAVALALQPTLENFFAGIQIVIDKPVLVGQTVRLESGEEGVVYEIGWRSTWIKTGVNNMVIIPNKNLINARILNYNYPDKQVAVAMDIDVHYQSDLDKVERVAIEVAVDVMKMVKGAVAEFKPQLKFHSLRDFSIRATVIMRAKEFGEIGNIKHEFIKRIVKRFAQEGIIIPYPIQAVDYEQEKNFTKLNSKA